MSALRWCEGIHGGVDRSVVYEERPHVDQVLAGLA